MKNKTMLRFLLCFSIIISCGLLGTANAVLQGQSPGKSAVIFEGDTGGTQNPTNNNNTPGDTSETEENAQNNLTGGETLTEENTPDATPSDETSSETTVNIVTGGPSAGAFFDEGDDFYSDMTGFVDAQLSPVKHIQGLIMYFGILIAIIVVIVFGIQWVTATSARKQELKAGMWPLAIGIVLLVIGPKLVISIYEAIHIDNATMIQHTNKVAGNMINVVQLIGYVVAIIMILVFGIQWVTANPNKRQELKSRMINIVIGAILIAGGVTILDWVANIAKNDFAYLENPRIFANNIEVYEKL